MSNLVEHARRELELIGEEPQTVSALLEIVQVFADMGHSGASAEIATQMLERLLRFQPLAPLTYGPEEWLCHEDGGDGKPLWQNLRDSAVFSRDGGATHYRVDGRED